MHQSYRYKLWYSQNRNLWEEKKHSRKRKLECEGDLVEPVGKPACRCTRTERSGRPRHVRTYRLDRRACMLVVSVLFGLTMTAGSRPPFFHSYVLDRHRSAEARAETSTACRVPARHRPVRVLVEFRQNSNRGNQPGGGHDGQPHESTTVLTMVQTWRSQPRIHTGIVDSHHGSGCPPPPNTLVRHDLALRARK
jgi:hypothetical protein